jgi:hypothetical protein
MRTYQFSTRDKNGLRLPMRQADFSTDRAALAFAHTLTTQSPIVEIWDDFRLVGSTFATEIVFGRELRAAYAESGDRLTT